MMFKRIKGYLSTMSVMNEDFLASAALFSLIVYELYNYCDEGSLRPTHSADKGWLCVCD